MNIISASCVYAKTVNERIKKKKKKKGAKILYHFENTVTAFILTCHHKTGSLMLEKINFFSETEALKLTML